MLLSLLLIFDCNRFYHQFTGKPVKRANPVKMCDAVSREP
jgi:hypothetical protein